MPTKKNTIKKRKRNSQTTVSENKSDIPAFDVSTVENDLAAVAGADQTKTKQSPYIVNLKNPHQDKFNPPKTTKDKSDSFSITSKLTVSKPRVPQRKAVPKKSSLRLRPEINLIPKQNVFQKFLSDRHVKPITQSDLKNKTNFQPAKENSAAPDIQVENAVSSAISAIEIPAGNEDIEDVFATPPPIKKKTVKVHIGYRPIALFILACVVLVLPFQALNYIQKINDIKKILLTSSDEAIDFLMMGKQAATNLDLELARVNFVKAQQKFKQAQTEIDLINPAIVKGISLLPGYGDPIGSGRSILASGLKMAKIGELLAVSGNQLFSGGSANDYYKSFIELDDNLKTAMGMLTQIADEIEQVQLRDIPKSQQARFTQAVQALPQLKAGLIEAHNITNALLRVLGHEQWQRYLLVFANNNELRAGGGFMGTFGILDVDRGEIKNLFIPAGGTYDVQGQLKAKVVSPEPFHLINPRWEFQDSNWWPDFPTSASKMQWFYENAWSQSVDGTIVLTSTLIENLLDVIGPIEMPEYNLTITSQNFVEETQIIIDQKSELDENRPKKFLAELAPKLMEELFLIDASKTPELLTVLQDGLNQRHLLMAFNNDRVQEVIDQLDWSGRVKSTQRDYLMVVHTNLAGGKTDGVIDEKIIHTVEVESDGSLIDTVTLRRVHNGIRGENIYTGVQNNSYVRFYVPEGSELIDATGFERPPDDLFEQPDDDFTIDKDLARHETNRVKHEPTGMDIYQESGKTVFGHWLQLQAGETQEATISYRLPFRLDNKETDLYYSLLVQKQHGSLGSQLESTISLPDDWETMAVFPEVVVKNQRHIAFAATLVTDQFYGAAFVQN